MTFYITGDTHGDFSHIYLHQIQHKLFKEEDTLIILGDAGFNYFVKKMEYEGNSPISNTPVIYRNTSGEQQRKRKFSKEFPGTVFCIHGNHEARPETVCGYEMKKWNGGLVYYQPEFPRILFAKDGEVYTLNGKQYLVIGGAYSVDKWYRLASGNMWFPDEQADELTKKRVEEVLGENDWKIHGILSHTAPFNYMPREMFLSGIDQSSVDDSMEQWLEGLEKKCEYDIWYFGHFHGNKHLDKTIMLFHDIEELR